MGWSSCLEDGPTQRQWSDTKTTLPFALTLRRRLEREASRATKALAVPLSEAEAKASSHEDCMKLIDAQDEMDSMVTNVEETQSEIAQQEIARRFVFQLSSEHQLQVSKAITLNCSAIENF
jgi:hypothetical protein